MFCGHTGTNSGSVVGSMCTKRAGERMGSRVSDLEACVDTALGRGGRPG